MQKWLVQRRISHFKTMNYTNYTKKGGRVFVCLVCFVVHPIPLPLVVESRNSHRLKVEFKAHESGAFARQLGIERERV